MGARQSRTMGRPSASWTWRRPMCTRSGASERSRGTSPPSSRKTVPGSRSRRPKNRGASGMSARSARRRSRFRKTASSLNSSLASPLIISVVAATSSCIARSASRAAVRCPRSARTSGSAGGPASDTGTRAGSVVLMAASEGRRDGGCAGSRAGPAPVAAGARFVPIVRAHSTRWVRPEKSYPAYPAAPRRKADKRSGVGRTGLKSCAAVPCAPGGRRPCRARGWPCREWVGCSRPG